MKLSLAALLMFCCVMVFALGGCTANQQFRTSFAAPGSPEADPAKEVIESTSYYKLGFVELDDQGWLWDDCQRVAVEQMIRTEAGLPADSSVKIQPGSTAQGIVLVVFVHGWKDNAAHDNYGVESFRSILKQLQRSEQAQQAANAQHVARKVVGVYIGWRGLSASWEPFKELSFWERKDAAHRVGGYGAMTQLFTELEDIQKDSLDSLQPKGARTELVIIGHSMGAAAVYSALGQIITQRFVNSIGLPPDKQKRLKPLGDQIIFLNPAFEASRYYDLNQMVRAIKKYPQDQRPVLSIFTSEGDWATHYVFPIGRFFSTLFDSYQSGEQKSANVDAVGWYKPFITHQLVYTKIPLSSTQPDASDAVAQGKEFPSFSQLVISHGKVDKLRGKWKPNRLTPQIYDFDRCSLRPINFKPGDPFLIVSVDKQIMHDHTDISDPVLITFLGEYIQFCQNEPTDHSK